MAQDANRLGLCGLHLRLAAQTKHRRCAPDPQHVCPSASASTPALLALWCRWSVDKRRGGVEKRSDTQGAWRAALGVFIQRTLGDSSFLLPVCLDATLAFDSGHVVPFVGDHPVFVSIENNEVNLSRLLSAPGRFADKVRRDANAVNSDADDGGAVPQAPHTQEVLAQGGGDIEHLLVPKGQGELPDLRLGARHMLRRRLRPAAVG